MSRLRCGSDLLQILPPESIEVRGVPPTVGAVGGHVLVVDTISGVPWHHKPLQVVYRCAPPFKQLASAYRAWRGDVYASKFKAIA